MINRLETPLHERSERFGNENTSNRVFSWISFSWTNVNWSIIYMRTQIIIIINEMVCLIQTSTT